MLRADPPPFFHRGPSPLARLAFFTLLSVALLVADSRFHYLEGMRRVMAVVIAPLQRAVLLPGEAYEAAASYFASKQALEAENAELKHRLLVQAPVVQAAETAQGEAARLKGLLALRERFGASATGVGVLFGSRDPFAQKLFIDRGGDAGIVLGTAVIDEAGVVGQVTRVFPSMAEVTLVTDKDQAVPVMIERTGARGVLYGAGSGRTLELRFVPPSTDIAAGDRLVTSGLDGTYPAGLAVARVDTVERDSGKIFAKVSGSPLGGVDRSRELLVLGAGAAMPERPDEPVAKDPSQKSGRGKARRGG